MISAAAASILSTRGARDLRAVYAIPSFFGLLALWLMAPEPASSLVHFAYPATAMIVGLVVSEMLYLGHRQAFVATRRLAVHAMTDPLTGLLNRRAMDDVLRGERRSRQSGMAHAVIMADLDHFKRINDVYGHEVGDEVLKELSRRLRESVRAEDHVARWGGEEFLVLLQGIENDEAAWHVADQIRRRVGEAPFPTSAGMLPVTLSVGIAASSGAAPFRDVIERADRALYAAKREGRNRVKACPEGATATPLCA